MSWFSSNYEKVLLGTGAVVALGAAYLGWSQLNAVDDEFSLSLKGRGNDNAAVEGAERITKALLSMQLDHGWKQAIVDPSRPVDLFTGIPLFIKRSSPSKAVDIVKGGPVHPDIENSFWLNYRIDPGFADSPMRDPDSDGFNNREEYLAKTDPTDSADHPPLISKLLYVQDESLAWELKPGFAMEKALPNGDKTLAFSFKYRDEKKQRNKVAPAQMISQGDVFFDAEPMKGRFKVLGHVVRQEMNQAVNMMEETTFVRIEDQKPNKKGQIYELPAPMNDKQAANFRQFDRSAVVSLEALGVDGEQVVIEENTAFSLPFGRDLKQYVLKAVTPEFIEVEYPGKDGQRLLVQIPKGQLPKL